MERQTRNKLLAEERKRKKDAGTKKRDKNLHACEQVEKRRRQQKRDGLPEGESLSELDSDEDFDDLLGDDWLEGRLGMELPWEQEA